uniref:Uncharacterized protein n=1 Tax=Macrostomum lignano TaxID=282301 RepID=A0A1I8F7X2_9PLAT
MKRWPRRSACPTRHLRNLMQQFADKRPTGLHSMAIKISVTKTVASFSPSAKHAPFKKEVKYLGVTLTPWTCVDEAPDNVIGRPKRCFAAAAQEPSGRLGPLRLRTVVGFNTGMLPAQRGFKTAIPGRRHFRGMSCEPAAARGTSLASPTAALFKRPRWSGY